MFSCWQSSDKVLVLGAPAIKAEKTATEAYDDAVAAAAEGRDGAELRVFEVALRVHGVAASGGGGRADRVTSTRAVRT